MEKQSTEKQSNFKKFFKFCKMFITRVFEHGIMSRGAELAYYFLFSFLPLIIFVAALISAMKIDISSFAGLEKLIPQDDIGVLSLYLWSKKHGTNGLRIGIERLFFIGCGTFTYERTRCGLPCKRKQTVYS